MKIWALAYWLGAVLGHAAGEPSCPRTMVRVGIIGDPVVDSFASRWSDFDSLERAYCLVTGTAFPYPNPAVGDSIYRVFGVLPAQVTRQDATSIDYGCPKGTVGLHTHPLTAGVATCTPSRVDLETLAKTGQSVGVLQCGPRQFVWYFAADYHR